MSDIAAVFHWSPDVMHGMALHELSAWREQARQRAGVDDE
jgi:hypothetical protein